MLQDPPCHTSDQLQQQAAALEALESDPNSSQLRARLQGALLLSDMSAFKAANPGCLLEDFVRWHSPRDLQQDEDGSWRLSSRMGDSSNLWHQLWSQALPCPVNQQKPLLEPQLEGERVLHYLETLKPKQLFDQLLAVAVSAAMTKLAACDGAALPAAQHVLRRFIIAATPVLDKDATADLEDSELEFLLAEFHYLEQVRPHALVYRSHILMLCVIIYIGTTYYDA